MIPQKIGPFEAGEDVQFDVDVTYEDNGAAADLTGAVAHFRMARPTSLEDLAISDEASPASAHAEVVVESPPTAGIVEVTVPGEHTLALIGTYDWRVDVVDSTDARTLVARGYVTFNKRSGT